MIEPQGFTRGTTVFADAMLGAVPQSLLLADLVRFLGMRAFRAFENDDFDSPREETWF